MTQQNQRPIKVFRAGGVRASVWANESQIDGRSVIQHSVRIEKRFFDREINDWRSTECYFVNDLPRLRLVADQAFAFIALHESDGAGAPDVAGRTGAPS